MKLVWLVNVLFIVTLFGVIIKSSGLFSDPILVVRNDTGSVIPKVEVLTSVDESYLLHGLKPNTSSQVNISGRDKALWLKYSRYDGSYVKSNEIYVTTDADVYAVINDSGIELNYMR